MTTLIKKLVRKIKTKIYVFYIRKIRKFFRISSHPYISGDSFRKVSNHVLDDISNVNFNKIKNDDLIFIKSDYINLFFEKLKTNLKKDIKFKIITHNSDIEIEKSFNKLIKNYKITWFAQNLSFSNKTDGRFFPVPIGLENRNYLKNGKLSHFKKINSRQDKICKIFCSFNFSTNTSRIKIYNSIKDHDLLYFKKFQTHKEFINELSLYKYNICPPGNGLDTHRFWESLMVNTIPIVKKSDFINNFLEFDIPMLILDEWEDLYDYSETYLNDFYNNNFQLLRKKDYLYLNFWINKINSYNH